MRNHEVTTRHALLNADGSLAEPGWSRSLIQKYDRRAIHMPGWKIKEWDYYLVMNDHYAGAFTMADLGYVGMISVSLINLDERWEHTETALIPFSMGKFRLSADSSQGDAAAGNKRVRLGYFHKENGSRRIRCRFKDFWNKKPLTCDITLAKSECDDSMVIATPWRDAPKAFYYNQKLPLMPAEGTISYDGKEYTFRKEDSYGCLDWGRGVWTYQNRWYWGIGNGKVDGEPWAFNIGYGFGDTAAATENMLFYGGKAHKLDEVIFHIPSNRMHDWKFTSSDGRFEMDFHPVLDRAALTNIGVIKTDQHQVFGWLDGRAVLDDGAELKVKNFMCACEDVFNRY